MIYEIQRTDFLKAFIHYNPQTNLELYNDTRFLYSTHGLFASGYISDKHIHIDLCFGKNWSKSLKDLEEFSRDKGIEKIRFETKLKQIMYLADKSDYKPIKQTFEKYL